MRLFFPRDLDEKEQRVSIIPTLIPRLTRIGAEVVVESGAGTSLHLNNALYAKAGASIATRRADAFATADLVLRLNPPPDNEINLMKRGAIHISYLDPFAHPERVKALADAHIAALCMEMIPRTTIAQKMDALSSQANLAGYVAVLQAVNRLDKIVPMMMTPAGTLAPAKVFVIGAGVAGLQAIATAKRLGARVEAFDTRPVVEEQVQSLGARFLKINLGETGQTGGGYAKELTPEQLETQRQAMARACAQADIVITTAQLFGRKAPRLITDAMIEGMTPGSVIVDMAAETGGNVEGSVPGRDLLIHGVTVIGASNLAGKVPAAASQMYASNLVNLVEHFWDAEANSFTLDPNDEIINGALLTFDGQIVNSVMKERMT
ncbi:MAG TPA: Re/Si-specific NAD(P)(+) transhydrogenase subunit alpha [Verrucomicrobia bacterium]|nr:Re/Si-specific NAD(P)(+) transhydrogenase subunit alpha [Verrucomicrobiota bacterium]